MLKEEMNVGKRRISSLSNISCVKSSTGLSCSVNLLGSSTRLDSTSVVGYTGLFWPLFRSDYLDDSGSWDNIPGLPLLCILLHFPSDCISCWEANCKGRSLPGLNAPHAL